MEIAGFLVILLIVLLIGSGSVALKQGRAEDALRFLKYQAYKNLTESQKSYVDKLSQDFNKAEEDLRNTPSGLAYKQKEQYRLKQVSQKIIEYAKQFGYLKK